MKQFLLALALLGAMNTFAQTLEDDRLALVALYNSTKGAGWSNKTGWAVPGVTGDNPCGWFGITCAAGRVTGVDLNHNSLDGALPAQLNNLSALVNLDLSFNSLKGTIPNILGIPVSAIVDIRNNRFNFAGMEENYTRLDYYSDQAKIPIGAVVPLRTTQMGGYMSIYVAGKYVNNTYKWYLNNVFLESHVGQPYCWSWSLGTYRVEVTNSLATGVTLMSEDYEVTYIPAMPVTLVSLSVNNKDSNNLLTWKTTSETNNSGFEIEKSPDAKIFEKIGFVDGNGDSKETKTYSFTDLNPFATTYYRLKQIDFDGKFEYSRIISVKNEAIGFAVYPNPAQNQLFVANLEKAEEVLIRNLDGKVFLKQHVDSKVPVNTSNFPSGLYFITIGNETRKILIQK